MGQIHHRLEIGAPVATVYETIAAPERIGRWWDEQVPIQTDRGLVMEHDPGPEHGVVRLRVVERVPNRRVEWECVSTHPVTSPASAWTGTHFLFELAERGVRAGPSGGARHGDGGTVLDFRQVGYDERSQFFRSNDAAWGQVLQRLKQVVESEHR